LNEKSLEKRAMVNSDTVLVEKLTNVSMFSACEQCGTCSSACPITGKDGFNIRRILRSIDLDLIDEIVNSPLPWSCTTCGRCEDVCPNGIHILEIIRPLREISPQDYRPEGPPCLLSCPANVNVPGYVKLIAEGKTEEAYALIREKLPLPGILGRVCVHPCEEACKRGEVNDPIAICALKRYASDNNGSSISEKFLKVASGTGQRVAIVGAGPAGLTVAFYLRKKGHQVTIFEATSKIGGMMVWGIPEYRLPREVLEKDIEFIQRMGIEVKTNTSIGSDLTLDDLFNQGFKAVFLGTGAQKSMKLEVEGEEKEGVIHGVDYLRKINSGQDIPLGDRVAVIGGGNVAIDVSRTAIRKGSKEVFIIYRRSRKEMPALEEEITKAEEEGVKIHYLVAPKRVLSKNGKVNGIECLRMELGEPDESGRPRPVPISGSEFNIEVDSVVPAIGQFSDLSFLPQNKEWNINKRGSLEVDPETQTTNISGVFAGGDITRGPASIIEAIADGRKAASAIDKFLGGDGNIDETYVELPPLEPFTEKRDKGFSELKRVEIPTISVSERLEGFREVEQCFSEEQAKNEAKRCLQCYLEIMKS
jgi:putative selenate reductase YgfK subunit